MEVAARPGSNNTVVFQDRISAGASQSLNKVEFTWAGVTYQPSKVEYLQADGRTWATTVYVPPGDKETYVRYTYENVDTDHVGEKGVIGIWVTINDHPTLPAPVRLYDVAKVWINGQPSREVEVPYGVAGPYIKAEPSAQSPTVYAGQTATANFDNLRTEHFGVGLPPGPFTERATLKLSPCLMNVVPPSGFVLTKSPDLGPDGLRCTGDDVSGWEFTKTNTFEPNRKDIMGDRTVTNYTFTYTVPAYVPDSTRIPYTSVYEVEGYPASTATANILVNTTKTFSQMKWTDTPLVQVGEGFNWYINWSNGSPTAGSIVVSDNLPTGLTQPIAVSFASGTEHHC